MNVWTFTWSQARVLRPKWPGRRWWQDAVNLIIGRIGGGTLSVQLGNDHACSSTRSKTRQIHVKGGSLPIIIGSDPRVRHVFPHRDQRKMSNGCRVPGGPSEEHYVGDATSLDAPSQITMLPSSVWYYTPRRGLSSRLTPSVFMRVPRPQCLVNISDDRSSRR